MVPRATAPPSGHPKAKASGTSDDSDSSGSSSGSEEDAKRPQMAPLAPRLGEGPRVKRLGGPAAGKRQPGGALGSGLSLLCISLCSASLAWSSYTGPQFSHLYSPMKLIHMSLTLLFDHSQLFGIRLT